MLKSHLRTKLDEMPGSLSIIRRLDPIVLLMLSILAVASPPQVLMAPVRALTSQGLSTAPPSFPSVTMTTVGGGFETSVAVNPKNPMNVIVTGCCVEPSSENDSFGIASVSSDGGRTWRNTNSTFTYVSSVVKSGWGFADPVGTFDADGTAYIGTVLFTATGDYLFKSTDNGNTFTLSSPFFKTSDDLLDYQTGAIVHLCQSETEQDFPAVIADPYGTSPYKNNVYVYVRVAAQIDPYTCFFGQAFERSTDGGKTWGAGVWFGGPYSGIASDFSLSNSRGMAVAPDGTFFLTGPTSRGALVLKTTDGGASFQREMVHLAPIQPNDVEVAAVSSSNIFVVFYGGDPVNGFHLYSVFSVDGGSIWSSPARIDDVISPDRSHVASAGGPDMWDFSLSPRTGRLDVAWFDNRYNGGNYTLADLYYSYSFDGLSWVPNVRLTPDGPYFVCTRSAGRGCTFNGNDFMWVASSYTRDGSRVYIAASMGKVPCSDFSTALYTRFVTIALSPVLQHRST